MNEKKLRITKKTVRALIKRELGISVTDPVAKELPYGTYYDIPIGEGFMLNICPYTFKNRIVIHFALASNFVVHSIHLFFDPISLERDFDVEDEYQRKIDGEKCDGCFYIEISQRAR